MALPAPKPSIDTCTACGKLFPRINMRLCTQCSLVEEHRFELVRMYLIENDGAAVTQIARATGVSGTDVRKFMDGGRLVEINGGANGPCTCGGVGERCRSCRAQLAGKFRDMEQTMARELTQRDADPRRRSTASDDAHGRTSYVRRIRRINDADGQ